MKILVCGGAGFIGSAFIRNYLQNHPDSKITNLDMLTIGSNLANLNSVKNNTNYKFLKDNIRNDSIECNCRRPNKDKINIREFFQYFRNCF